MRVSVERTARAGTDVITAISNLENDGVKADLDGDPVFYQKVLAEDWTRNDSDGTYYTKAELLGLMAETKKIKTNSEKLSELRVRVYGNTAVATYKDTYDLLIMGEHRARRWYRGNWSGAEGWRLFGFRNNIEIFSDEQTPRGNLRHRFHTRNSNGRDHFKFL